MGADAEQRVKAGLLADNPDPLVLHEALGHLAYDEICRIAGLECGRRLEEDAREKQSNHCGAAGGESSQDRSPPCNSEQVSPRPDVLAAPAFLKVRHSKSTSGDRGVFIQHLHTMSRRRPFGIRALTATIQARLQCWSLDAGGLILYDRNQ